MQKSTVYVSMNDTNNLDCSYAIIEKESKNTIIIFKGLECIILDYDLLINDNYNNHYLLLKHYENTTKAYKDFMKLIGKMCKKSADSKYFKKPVDEDNWIVFENDTNEHMITIEEKANYLTRKNDLINFINDNKDKFIKE